MELTNENISILFNPAINNALSADPANAKYFRSLNSSFVRKIPHKNFNKTCDIFYNPKKYCHT